MERFQCLADRCEDTCCRDWAVSLDRESVQRLKETLATKPGGRDRLVHLVVLGKAQSGAEGQAHLQMTADGACPLLEADNRCGVHAEFGEGALASTCSIFPRTSLAVSHRLEVGGSLGCPEVARQFLLHEDALTMRPVEKTLLPRPYVGKQISVEAGDGYAEHFEEVREALVSVFAAPAALGTRLAVAAQLAQRVHEFFHRGTRAFSGPGRSFAARRLSSELMAVHGQTFEEAKVDLAELRAPGENVMSLVLAALLERRRLAHSARFGALLNDVFSCLQSQALGRPAGAEDASTPSDLWDVYRSRRDRLDALLGGRTRAVFSNWARHFLYRHPFTDSASLREHLFKLALELAAIRLLLVGHPALTPVVNGQVTGADAESVFDRTAVHVVQTLTKAIGHHPAYREAWFGSMAGNPGAFSFGQLILLAKFV